MYLYMLNYTMHHFFATFHLIIEMELMCTSPPPLLRAKYDVTLPVNSRIDSDRLHNNVVVMGDINKGQNATAVQPTDLMFLVGSVASYSCKNGFVMTGGGPSLMCFSNGSWVGNIGTCEGTVSPKCNIALACTSQLARGQIIAKQRGVALILPVSVHPYKCFSNIRVQTRSHAPLLGDDSTMTCQQVQCCAWEVL